MTKRVKKFYIKERDNPQLGVYYVPMGQMSKSAAKRYENTLYGSNEMIPYDTEAEYNEALRKLICKGEKVRQ